MAESAYLPAVAIQNSKVLDSPRHSALVRVTHWIHTLSFIALVLSGIAILLAHPRLYWGETGAVRLGASIPRPGSVSPFSLRLGFCVNRFALRPLRACHPPLLEEPGAKQGGSRLEIDPASGLESYAFGAAGGGRVPEL